MNQKFPLLRDFRSHEGGAAAVEFAIVGLAMILFSIGVIEFGRGLLIRNNISYLADVGSRAILIDPSVSDSTLKSRMQAEFSGDAALLKVATVPETVDGIKYRTVSIIYPLSLLVPSLVAEPLNLGVTRRVPIS